MTYYSRSAYGSVNPNAGYPANGNKSAWGGYACPNCPPSSLQGTTSYVSKSTGGQLIKVSVRKEIVQLWNLAFQICDEKWNYPTWASRGGEAWGPWGGECRYISGTTNPSGHSMWLSVDINAPYNPYSYTFQSDMPPGMVADLESLGLYWGGRYENQKYDAMHFGYCRTPGEVAGYVSKAQSILGGSGGGGGGDDDVTTDDSVRSIVRDELAKFFSKDQVSVGGDEMSDPSTYNSTRDALFIRINRLTSMGTAGITGRDGASTEIGGSLKKFFTQDTVQVSGDEMSNPPDYKATRDAVAARAVRLSSIGTAAITGKDGKAPVPPK
jgi:hypothetical protein